MILICAAAQADAVNEAVAEALGNSAGARNLSVPLSSDGAAITHYGGHGWFRDNQAKALSQIAGLTISGADVNAPPFEHWLVAIKAQNVRTVAVDENDLEKFTVEERREPTKVAEVNAAKEVFASKPTVKLTGGEEVLSG